MAVGNHTLKPVGHDHLGETVYKMIARIIHFYYHFADNNNVSNLIHSNFNLQHNSC